MDRKSSSNKDSNIHLQLNMELIYLGNNSCFVKQRATTRSFQYVRMKN